MEVRRPQCVLEIPVTPKRRMIIWHHFFPLSLFWKTTQKLWEKINSHDIELILSSKYIFTMSQCVLNIDLMPTVVNLYAKWNQYSESSLRDMVQLHSPQITTIPFQHSLIVTAGLVLLLWTGLWCAQAPQNSHWRLQSGCNYHSLYLNKETQLHHGIWWHRRSSHVYSWGGRWSSKTRNSNHLWANHVKNRTSKYFCLAVRRTCSRPCGSWQSVSWFWVDVRSEELGEHCG